MKKKTRAKKNLILRKEGNIMSKKLMIKIILPLLVLTTCIVIPASYARYITDSSGIGQIDIAKWEIIINDKSMEEEFDFNLFETLDNPNIKDGITAISPGTSGNITLNLKNSSDVVAEYTITLEEISNENSIPIVYSLEENGEYKKINEFTVANKEEIGINNGNTKTITIYWKWDYYNNSTQNQKDNELGENGTARIQVKASVKVNQKIN